MRGSGAIEDVSEQTESRLGIKKCCSRFGVDCWELPVWVEVYVDGIDGIGGAISGDSGADRTVTPGI